MLLFSINTVTYFCLNEKVRFGLKCVYSVNVKYDKTDYK